MKAWAVVQDGPNASGWIGNVFHTESSAMRWVGQGYDDMRVVEIEIPDPPHEWKVGDWFHFGNGWPVIRIAFIAGGGMVGFSQREDGSALAYEYSLADLDDATPCDPPDWWEGDR